ncbi:MAG: hypothetical protein AB8G11_10135 [Saprospiraceae bacterium]
MVDSKLITLLKTFNKYELNRLRKYVESPFFNENELLIDLFDVIDKFLRSNRINLEQKAVWRSIFNKKTYNDTKFRRLCSDLNKLAQDFLAIEDFKNQPLAFESYQLRLLNYKGLDKHYLAVERNAQRDRDRLQLRDAMFFYNNAMLEYEKHVYLEKHGVMRTKKVNLSAADLQLDCFFLSLKLKNYCDAINYKNILNIDIQIGMIQELLDIAKRDEYQAVPAVAIYYQILLTLTDREDEAHFFNLKKLLNENNFRFQQQEMRNMYIFAQNYCIKKINTGNAKYYRELFDIYKTLIETKIILNKGIIVPWDYKNITSVGLRVGEYKWVEKFIKNYNQHLPKDHQKNTLTYNLAILHFYKKDYNEVITLLRDMSYKDVFDALQGRWLLLKTYYELDEYDALDALIDSFRIFLRRNKSISKSYQKMYMNAIKFLQKIMKVPYESKSSAEKLYIQIKECSPIAERRWLLQKLEEIR